MLIHTTIIHIYVYLLPFCFKTSEADLGGAIAYITTIKLEEGWGANPFTFPWIRQCCDTFLFGWLFSVLYFIIKQC